MSIGLLKNEKKTTGGELRLNNVKNSILLFPHLYNLFSAVFPDRREVPVARILHARDQWLLRQSKIALPDLLLDQRNVCPQALPHKHGCHELLRHLKDRIAVQFQDLPRIPLHDQTDINSPWRL